ncbi:translation initiation factor eIF 4e-like domain-containing protein [Vararia minispora EC-137]|uniref:Translation initiation factor eIF 4e-like domain-containing protein n=1 Tax=Vararia minispora EC-137 TaxID=1314806 RepID=A0ACB8QU86_9AGAM|nr:translation initiation factor eIF 4e-like domain-containing protein [Vararia minispora EC-137]
MAGYFSNHSAQSRFLSNSATTGAGAGAAGAKEREKGKDAPTASTPTRRPSKHFATSLGEDDTGSVSPVVHPLRSTWVFWFRQQRTPGNKITNYEEGIKKIGSFASVESFWSLWTHLHPPSSLLPTTDYLLFHESVRRPVWEDPLNISGGKWILRLRKGVADRLWEDLVLALVGDQFAHVGGGGGGGDADVPEICGATISVRQNEDIVSVWNRVEADKALRERIRDTIRRVLNLPSTTVMEYKTNNDSMQDKSSFRNSAIDRTPLS